MLQYILKRLLIFIPTLLIISLLTFIISINTPGDPVEQMISSSGTEGSISAKYASERAYIEKRQQLGLDLPVFYFTVSTAAAPDTLHRIQKKQHRELASGLVKKHGNWPLIAEYYHSLKALEYKIYSIERNPENASDLIDLKNLMYQLYDEQEGKEVKNLLKRITESGSHIEKGLLPLIDNAHKNFNKLISTKPSFARFVPAFHWHGFNNQYHRWFFGNENSDGFIRGDFGISYQSKRPVSSEIKDAVGITLQLSLLAIFITYLVAIPLGLFAAADKGGWKDQVINTIVFLLYSLPVFWIGSLMIIFLGGGDWLDWFPPYGLGEIYEETSFWEALSIRFHHLVLPVICLIYPTIAYLTRQTRGGIVSALSQDYIRTARAKGVKEVKVVSYHAFRNALLPVITLFASVFPATIVGAVIVEIVFSIPGMGKLTLEALYARNYPVVYTIVMLSAILTMVGYLVADILYAVADPRIKFSSKK